MSASRPWLAQYPKGVPAEIDLEQYRNIVSVLEDSCDKYRSKPAWPLYQDLLTFAAVIRRDLDRKPGFRARDMIDLQSFMWVQGAPEYET